MIIWSVMCIVIIVIDPGSCYGFVVILPRLS